MKILTVVGARPQFIKAAPVGRALRQAGGDEFMVHTGQHYDHGMSQVFFDELGIPAPQVNLEIGSGHHGWQTGKMLEGIEAILLREKPDWVLVYGDTNSTLAGALAAAKLQIPLAHVEAGLRSYNREMPEEHNRVLTDHCADLLFCPTETAAANLRKEGITQGVHQVGDPMYDAVLQFSEAAEKKSTILQALGLTPKQYSLATLHRPANVDDEAILREILAAFEQSGEKIIFPVHPRTRHSIDRFGIELASAPNIHPIAPLGYLDMLALEKNARVILTDSGGMQKEAYFFQVPCITLREETEWVETLEDGANVLTGADRERILAEFSADKHVSRWADHFGDGHAAETIADLLSRYL